MKTSRNLRPFQVILVAYTTVLVAVLSPVKGDTAYSHEAIYRPMLTCESFYCHFILTLHFSRPQQTKKKERMGGFSKKKKGKKKTMESLRKEGT